MSLKIGPRPKVSGATLTRSQEALDRLPLLPAGRIVEVVLPPG